MSRLWSSPATLALAPEGIAMSQGGKSRLLMQGEASDWKTLLDALRDMAQGLAIRRARIILSAPYVRYAVLPPQPAVVAARDWQALGAHALRQLYGAVADDWVVRVSLQGHGAPAVACALERALLDELQRLAGDMRWRLTSIEPDLMAVFNRHRRQLPATAWLLLAGPQRLLLAELAAGRWERFSLAHPLAGEEPASAAALLERAARRDGAHSPGLLACFGDETLLPVTYPAGMSHVGLQRAPGTSPLQLAEL